MKEQKKQNRQNTKLTHWYTSDEVFGKARRTKAFHGAYQKEALRLHLARQVRTVRHRKRLTQKIVAERASMTQSTIARLERGERGFSIDTLGRIARALGKDLVLK